MVIEGDDDFADADDGSPAVALAGDTLPFSGGCGEKVSSLRGVLLVLLVVLVSLIVPVVLVLGLLLSAMCCVVNSLSTNLGWKQIVGSSFLCQLILQSGKLEKRPQRHNFSPAKMQYRDLNWVPKYGS